MTGRKEAGRKGSSGREAPDGATTHAGEVHHDVSGLTGDDLHLFNEGSHYRLYEKLGAHLLTATDGTAGTRFAVWAPSAGGVSVMGDFNGWDAGSHPLRPVGSSGIWEGFVPGVEGGARYKYRVRFRDGGGVDKADPFGFSHEVPPATASVVSDLAFDWEDGAWMEERGRRAALDAPVAIYELHAGSWARVPEEGGRPLTWRELAPRLADHVEELGFTHVELLPVMEHPFYGSWGYQTTGYFAPSSRYGSPRDFMRFVDHLHRRGIGVILDWVPSHFPNDEHGLARFDGTHLYEHADPRKGFHPDWNSLIFNYGRHEVRSFLISSALFWLDRYHADGLRVDAVASMLYLDYSRGEGEWIPNVHGGRENLEALGFLRGLNEAVYEAFPDAQTFAEESTAWPMVSRPTYVGGLGFGLKWDMGWMHDTLEYVTKAPVHRKYHHDGLTFRAVYAFSENFVLPLSHDEVVHGKGSLLSKMPGDEWQKFANLRLLLGYMYAQAGKKLLFMGAELAQRREWNHDRSLDWHLADEPRHAGVGRWMADLNRLYRSEPALHERDCDPAGFEWVDASDWEGSAISFLRRGAGGSGSEPAGRPRAEEARREAGAREAPSLADGRTRSGGEVVLAVCNFTPVPRRGYRVGVPAAGPVDPPGGEDEGGHAVGREAERGEGAVWEEVLNSDAEEYGGSGVGNGNGVRAEAEPFHGRPGSLSLTLPPLGIVLLKGPAGAGGGA